MSSARALLACDVFSEEVAALLGPTPSAVKAVVWLEMGLHDHPDRLRLEIQASLSRIEQDPEIGTVLLGYGLCGRGLAGVRAQRAALVLPRAHDCISILLGGTAAHEAVLREEPGTYFYSPGWIRNRRVPGPDREAYLRSVYEPKYPDDPDMVQDLIDADREAFSHQRRAAYVDLTANAAAEAYCRRCAEHLNWEYRRLKGDASQLQDLLFGPWDDARFLNVPPGQAIALAADGTLCATP